MIDLVSLLIGMFLGITLMVILFFIFSPKSTILDEASSGTYTIKEKNNGRT